MAAGTHHSDFLFDPPTATCDPTTLSLPVPTWSAPADLHSSAGFVHIYCSRSREVRLFTSPSLLHIIKLIANTVCGSAWIDDDIWETCCVCAICEKRKLSVSGSFYNLYGGNLLLSHWESPVRWIKMLPVNSGWEGGKQPDDNGCLSLAFGSEPGCNQSWKIWLIQNDGITQCFITCSTYFNE